MGFSDFWRVETEVGYVEIELDFEGGELTDPEEIFDSQSAVDQITYALDNRNPRTTATVLEIYAQLHPERFPPGLSLNRLETRDIDPMRGELIRFIESAVESGTLRAFTPENIMGRMPDELGEAPVYTPQPVIPEKETFIGVHVTDQDGKPVPGTRVRVTLPDGDVRIGRTNRDGALKITGFSQDGMAHIELLDFNEAGAALPVDDDDPVTPQPEEQPFAVKLVDETGKVGIDGIVLVFRTADKEETVTTDGSGVAQWKAAAEDATVTVQDEKALCDKMAALWKSRPATPQSDYVKSSGDVSTAAARSTALETDDGGPFGSLSVPAKGSRVLSVHPAKKRAVIIEMHDTLFRNDSAVVNPEGEAPSSKVGEHEAISTVGLIATILRYNEEHPGKKLFIGGHTDRAGSEKGNVKLSEERAKAVLALIEGDKEAYVAACKAKHSEVDVTQLMDWAHNTYEFKCKPTKLTAAPSDENYVLFRKSYNDWCKGSLAEGEIGPRGTPIGPYGRLQDDIWAAMFELYEHNLRQELGEDAAAVQTLRGKVTWVSDSKKSVGYGESHPTAKNTIDGTRSQADRRVEVMMFDDGEEPNLLNFNGEDVYDSDTYKRTNIDAPPQEQLVEVRVCDPTGAAIPFAPFKLRSCGSGAEGIADEGGWAVLRLSSGVRHVLLEWEWVEAPTNKERYQSASVDIRRLSGDDALRQKLCHLGYDTEGRDILEVLQEFRVEFGGSVEDNDEELREAIDRWHAGGVRPARFAHAEHPLNGESENARTT
ncbi:MAG: OmpA family protein [Polyangiaceae bacterium]